MTAMSQTPPASNLPLPYGPPISLAMAKTIMVAAEREADANNWPMAIAIVDSTGHLVLFRRADHTQLGSMEVSVGKATTAVRFKRTTKAFEEAIAGGGAGVRVMTLPGVVALEGGVPIVVNGQIVGAIGVSGMLSTQDAQVCAAGLAAIAG
jgi:glc operon protein GlcG